MTAFADDDFARHSECFDPQRDQIGGGAVRKPSLIEVLATLLEMVASWGEKRRSWNAVADLTDAQLLDIGLTRAELGTDAARSAFWD